MCMHSVHDHIAITMLPHSISMSFASQEDRCSDEQKDKPYTNYTGAFRCVSDQSWLLTCNASSSSSLAYLACTWLVLDWLACTWIVCDLYLAWIWLVLGLHVLDLYVICTWLVLGLHTRHAHMSPILIDSAPFFPELP